MSVDKGNTLNFIKSLNQSPSNFEDDENKLLEYINEKVKIKYIL